MQPTGLSSAGTTAQQTPPTKQSSIKKLFSSMKTSKFRHIEGVLMHKNNNIENIRNLSMSTFGECDSLQVNSEFVAWLIAGPGGQIAVHQVCQSFVPNISSSPNNIVHSVLWQVQAHNSLYYIK